LIEGLRGLWHSSFVLSNVYVVLKEINSETLSKGIKSIEGSLMFFTVKYQTPKPPPPPPASPQVGEGTRKKSKRVKGG